MVQWIKSLWPKFDSQDPHNGRRELTPTNCPLTSTCVLWNVYTHMHAK